MGSTGIAKPIGPKISCCCYALRMNVDFVSHSFETNEALMYESHCNVPDSAAEI